MNTTQGTKLSWKLQNNSDKMFYNVGPHKLGVFALTSTISAVIN